MATPMRGADVRARCFRGMSRGEVMRMLGAGVPSPFEILRLVWSVGGRVEGRLLFGGKSTKEQEMV